MKKSKRMKIKVTRMIRYSKAEKLPQSTGGVGGFFGFYEPMRWKHYLDTFYKDDHPYLEAIREYVVKHKIRFAGNYHQDDMFNGCFLFSDNTSGTYTFRAWGDLLAAIWSEEENKDYSYMDFYYEGLIDEK